MANFSSLLRRALLLAGLPLAALAQTNAPGVGIGTTTPAASAVLDVTSSTQGVLLPRLTTTQRDAIASPATGLLIFNLDTQVLNSYDGTRWVPYVGVTPAPTTMSYTRTAFSPVSSGTYTYTVPAGVTALAVELAGGSGAGGSGGLGGRVQATLAVTTGQVLTIILGGSANNNTGTSSPNGGAVANLDYGGGGATDIRIGGTALSNRVLVAGGGGGTGNSGAGGAGGGLVARAGAGTGAGGGGTQTQGGSGGGQSQAGTLGAGGAPVSGSGRGGGGGGGYYGGGGGDGTGGGGGGGGSSYADPTLATGVVHTVGYNSGQGYVRLTPLSGPAPVLNGSNFYNVPGDNLGNHSATQNIGLNGNLLVPSTSSAVGLGLNSAGDVLASRAVVVDQLNASNGTFATTSTGLHFGSNSGEGIGSARTGSTNPFGLDFYTSSARRLSITGAGRVGIGTSAPTSALHVATETPADGILISSTSQPIALRLDNGQGTADLGLAYSTNQYATGANAGDAVLRANGDHNLLLAATGAGTVRVTDLVGTGTRLVTADANGSLGSQALPSGADFVQNQTASVQTAGFNIGGNGTVGGNATAGGAVQAGTSVVVDAAGANSGAVTGSILRFGSGTSGEGLGSKRTSGGNQFGLDFYTASANRMSITVGGQVGIGTTAPSQQLHVRANGTEADGLLVEGGGQPMSLSVKNAQGTADLGVANSVNEYATSAAPGDAVLRSNGSGSLLLTTAGSGRVRVPKLGDGSSTRFVTADAGGNLGTASTASLPGDNLGNHTATQALNLQGNALVGTGASISGVGVGVRADGGLNLGQNTAGHSVYLGYQAGAADNSSNNVFIGYQSGYQSTGGGGNIFAGYQSGYTNAGGMANVFIGTTSGTFNTTGSYNQFLGVSAGFSNTTGSDNTFLGYQSGNANTSGADNTFIGYQAGRYSSTGTYNASLGTNSGPASGSGNITNATAIGANVGLTQSNTVILGNNANVGIGTSTPGAKLEVSGAVRATAFNTTSDARLKADVRSLGGALASVLALRGVRYHWNALGVQRGGQAGAEQVGLLAQELEKVYPELVSTGPDGYKAVNYAQLAPVLIEALKEQQQQIETLKQQATAANARAAAAETQAARATATTEAFEARLRRLEAGSAQAQR